MAALVVDFRLITWVLGGFLMALAGTLSIPIVYALGTDRAALTGLFEALLLTVLAAITLLGLGYRRQRRELRQREAILLVVLTWVVVCLFGALPFRFSPYYPTLTDAVFEATSGFTTTGATVLADVDGLPRALHLWRCLSHWLGGIGIVLLGVAILPLLGQGGMALYRAEFSGSTAERLRPRIVETARALWRIYVMLTLAEFLCLLIAGMDAFEAMCHAFSTLGTGGFSTRTASVAAFHSPLIEYILILFMLLAGISFIQHFRLWVERKPLVVWRDYELRTFLWLVVIATALITANLVLHDRQPWEPALRAALFQVTSILTTTGFVTTDYAAWQPLPQLTLLVLMFIGGCTGSTAGGLKTARAALTLCVVQREFRRIAEPQGVFRIHLGGAAISEVTVSGLLNLVFLAWLVALAASLVLAATGVEVLTALSAVMACQFNVGPGLAGVGPLENYGGLSPVAKWTLSFCMVAGRLEFYTLLILFTGTFWRR
jgi:trk system potassium uptake protein TrkH